MTSTCARIAVLAVCLCAGNAEGAHAAEPAGFFGVVPQATPSSAELARLQGVVGTLRIPIYWSECEPAPGEFDFAALDALVGAAADHGIRVQPFVFGTPSWLAAEQARPPLAPRARAAWGDFLEVLVKRYGRGGEFWRGRSRRQPIRLWQVWNEPNFVVFWRPWPRPRAYARLLHISARALRRADPRARIALAGVAPVNSGIRTWVFLRRLFRVPGVGRDFDIAAIHPYATNLPQLDYQLRQARREMAGAGLGGRPLLVGELGVASRGDFPSAFVLGLGGQAEFLRMAYGRLLEMRRSWRIVGVDWFALRDAAEPDPNCSFCQGAGLLDLAERPKPAWWALRQTVESNGVR